MVPRPPSLAVVASALLLFACGAAVSPVGDGSTNPPDVVGGSDANDTAPTRDQGPPSDDVPRPICFVDFPCQSGETIRCVSATTYVAVVTHDCHHTCGPGPCSGGSCDAEGPTRPCPTDTICTRNDRGISACVPVARDAGVDASPDAACTRRPDREGCCYQDSDCGGGNTCFSANCDRGSLGQCVPPAPAGRCWRDTDCGPSQRCEAASYCPCGAVCAAGTEPGRCVPR